MDGAAPNSARAMLDPSTATFAARRFSMSVNGRPARNSVPAMSKKFGVAPGALGGICVAFVSPDSFTVFLSITFLVGVAASAVMVVLPYYLHDYKLFGKITILGEFLAMCPKLHGVGTRLQHCQNTRLAYFRAQTGHGGFNRGEPPDVVSRMLRQRGVPLYAVGVGDPANTDATAQLAPRQNLRL